MTTFTPYRLYTFAAPSLRKLTRRMLVNAKALFAATEELQLARDDGEVECIEDVQVVLVSSGATPEDIEKLENKFYYDMKGPYVAVEDGMLFIYKNSCTRNGCGKSELCRQIGNSIRDFRSFVAAVIHAGFPGALGGIQPDFQIYSRRGFPPESVCPETRSGSARVVFEVEAGNRSGQGLRHHGHLLFTTGGLYLRRFVVIKVYPQRVDSTHAVLVVVYGRNADDDEVAFRYAISIGTAPLSARELAGWQDATLMAALPPIGPIEVALHPAAVDLVIPSADIWYQIRETADGPFLPIPVGFAPLRLDLRELLEYMSIPLS